MSSQRRIFSVSLFSSQSSSSSSSSSADRDTNSSQKKKKKKSGILLKDLWKHRQQVEDKRKSQPSTKRKRTRKRVEDPQQVYVYASQRRRKLQQQEQNENDGTVQGENEIEDQDEEEDDNQRAPSKSESWVSKVKREYGFVASTQQCEPDIRMPREENDDSVAHSTDSAEVDRIVVPQMEMACPQYLRRIRIGPGTDPNQDYAYVLTKPPGWSIVGGGGSKGNGATQVLPKCLTPRTNGDKGDEKAEEETEELPVMGTNTWVTVEHESPQIVPESITEAVPANRDDDEVGLDDQMHDLNTPGHGEEDADEEADNEAGGRWIVELNDGEEEEVDAQDLFAELTDEELLEFMSPDDVAFWRKEQQDAAAALGEGRGEESNDKDMEEVGQDDVPYDPSQVLQLLTPQEMAELEQDGGLAALQLTPGDDAAARAAAQAIREGCDEATAAARAEEARRNAPAIADPQKFKRGADGAGAGAPSTVLATGARPSLVAWFKNYQKTKHDVSIKAGRHFQAVGGATEVDDSGLVLLCPRSWEKNQDSLFVDYIRYVAIVGNGGFLAKRPGANSRLSSERVKVETQSRLRKGRRMGGTGANDMVQTLQVTVIDGLSTCGDNVVQICQDFATDGIRGHVQAHPLDVRASRRLLHCSEMSLSSLRHADGAILQIQVAPDDVRLWSSRQPFEGSGGGGGSHTWTKGSFLGRLGLQQNPLTTAYREINGAGDGYPGWIVDRYDKWLLVQRQEQNKEDDNDDGNWKRGPLPPLEEGVTEGIYGFTSIPDRSKLSSSTTTTHKKPVLMEGRAIPAQDGLRVLENGITYLIDFSHLSTGLFLDQRLQRAWLARYCTPDTAVLNCFAHCGAFSVAAATAGASTVNVDLDKKWLDRLEPQLRANGITDMSRHDCIYGDCFDWLVRLGKRGAAFDVVILDPPSTSVGGRKKKRWSLQNDMDELVALAATLVKPNGLLWTTTNSASISSERFAKLCWKGLQRSPRGAKLERVAPMPLDFPSVGPQPVTNLVWRLAA